MRIKRIHHLTLAVHDVDAARGTFERLLRSVAGDARDVPAFGVRSADIEIGESALQLASPLDPDNPLMRFLDRRGEGFYNLALEVDDLDAAVRELEALGVRVSPPVEPQPGMRAAFLARAATHGISIQLIELAGDDGAGEASEKELQPEPTALIEEAPAEPPPSNGDEEERPPLLDLTPDEWSDVD